METIFTSKNIKLFICEKCDFKCSKKGDFSRHISTTKHKKKNLDTDFTSFTSNQYVCNCGKEYKNRAGLWKHKQKCSFNCESAESTMTEYLLKENFEIKKDNLEMKKIMIDLCKKLEPISNISNVNSNNVFNINVFLDEQCKDAMNMTEFIESIQLNVQDMMKIADDGQTKGMSNILIDKLNSMDVFKRPVHCSDIKNETIYIKDEDKWEKEEKDKPKLKIVLDKLTKKSIDAMPCMDDDPDAYVKTISEVLKDPREDRKIISNIAKEISIK